MHTYYFEDLETGLNFFVQCETIAEAIDTAKTCFQRPRFLGIVDTEWAEIMGFDTYQLNCQTILNCLTSFIVETYIRLTKSLVFF